MSQQQKLVSPGVFTEERDQTSLGQGIQEIGGGFVGATHKGPAFVPITVRSFRDYKDRMGAEGYYLDHTVREYLQDESAATISRPLGFNGYVSEGAEVSVEASTDDSVVMFSLAPSRKLRKEGGEIVGVTAPSGTDPESFTLDVDVSFDEGSTTATESFEVSLDPDSETYVNKLFGTSPDTGSYFYTRIRFPELWASLLDDPSDITEFSAEFDATYFDYEDLEYSPARTPWIVSQDQQPAQPGNTREQLFRFRTISDGDTANTDVKVSIERVRYADEVPGGQYGAFDVVVREFDDTDRNRKVLERFDNVNLDPTSDNYVAEIIGDVVHTVDNTGRIHINGEYENQSKYVVVEVNKEVEQSNRRDDELSELVPWGYESYEFSTATTADIPHGVKPRISTAIDAASFDPLADPQQDSTSISPPFDNRINYGFDFETLGNISYLQGQSKNPGTPPDSSFVLSDVYVPDPNDLDSVITVSYGDGEDEGFPADARSFNVGFQGGFDGLDPNKPVARGEDIEADNLEGFDFSTTSSSGSRAWQLAFDLLSNDDQYDINLLVTPGLLQNKHPRTVEAGIEMARTRGDVFYPFDSAGLDSRVSDPVSAIRGYDTSYAATYYPWVNITDNIKGGVISVPPTVVVPRVYAFNDQEGAEWTAPAGLNRGRITSAVNTNIVLTKGDRDTLYENRVNPIAYFFDEGVVAYGQKTLQVQRSALDRINVRRLLIRAKKFLASTSKYLLFEQNVPQTRSRFLNIANPFFNRIQQDNGLFDFRVIMDGDNNDADVIDRNQLVGEIYLQPTRTAEFISLTFTLVPTGAEFPE